MQIEVIALHLEDEHVKHAVRQNTLSLSLTEARVEPRREKKIKEAKLVLYNSEQKPDARKTGHTDKEILQNESVHQEQCVNFNTGVQQKKKNTQTKKEKISTHIFTEYF